MDIYSHIKRLWKCCYCGVYFQKLVGGGGAEVSGSLGLPYKTHEADSNSTSNVFISARTFHKRVKTIFVEGDDLDHDTSIHGDNITCILSVLEM